MNTSIHRLANDEAYLREAYLTRRFTDIQIAKEVAADSGFPCSSAVIKRARRRFRIEGRGRGRVSQFPQFEDRDWLVAELETKTLSQLAREQGCSVARVSGAAKKLGLSTGTMSEAVAAGLRKRFPNGRTGKDSARWLGGRTQRGDYYFLHRDAVAERWPNHPRLAIPGWTHKQEHVLVMEAIEGRMLRPEEVVHHGEKGKLDNSPDNLKIKEKGQHIREHFADSHKTKALRVEIAALREENARLRAEPPTDLPSY